MTSVSTQAPPRPTSHRHAAPSKSNKAAASSSSQSATRRRSATGEHRLPRVSLVPIVRSEYIKATSLRSTWWILGLATVLLPVGALISGLLSRFVASADPALFNATMTQKATAGGSTPQISEAMVWGSATSFVGISALLIAIWAALLVSSEFSKGSIQMSLVAVPRRNKFLTAKAVIAVEFSFLAGLIGSLVAWLGAQLSFSGLQLSALNAEERTRLAVVSLLGTAIGIALYAVIGLGIAALFRSSVGSVLGIFGLFYMIPMVFSVAGVTTSQLGWLNSVSEILPSSLLQTFLSADISAVAVDGPSYWVPQWWMSFIMLMIWALLAAVGGYAVLKKKDVQ